MTEAQKQHEAYYGFIQDFVSDYDHKPSVFEAWKHQQQRIDELESKLKIAVDRLKNSKSLLESYDGISRNNFENLMLEEIDNIDKELKQIEATS